MKTKLVILAAAVAFVTVAVRSLQAQSSTENTLTISATAIVQTSTDNFNFGNVPPLQKLSITTKQILQFLAADEHAKGTYPFANFPSGAKLVVFMPSFEANFYTEWYFGTNSQEAKVFQVQDKKGAFLVDVSDILSLSYGNGSAFDYHDEFSGNFDSNTTGLALPSWTTVQLATLNFDDTGIIGGKGLKFSLNGLETSTFKDTKPNVNTGFYTETQTHTINSATGSGSYGSQIFITGTVSASGKEGHSTSEISL